MTGSRFLDTNILLYSISEARQDRAKRDVAVALLDRRNNALSLQVLQEFYVQATRSTRPNSLSHDLAVGFVRTWLLRFPVQDITAAILDGAFEIKAAHGLSCWDAAVVAAARVLGCREVLTEDMPHGQKIAGVLVTNPFL